MQVKWSVPYYRYQSERQKFEEKRSKYNSILKEMEHDLDFTLIEHSIFTQVDFQDGVHPTIDGDVPLLVRNIKQKLNPILRIELNGEYKRRNFTQNRFQEFRSRDNETQRFRPLGNPRYDEKDRYDYFKSDERT